MSGGLGSARPGDDCFAPPEGEALTPVEVALARLETALETAVAEEPSALGAAAGRILARPVLAARAHPACDNAAVDGYAFRHPGAGDLKSILELRLAEGRAAAGAPWSGALAPGEAVRILTGAAMPDGADTVALQEDAIAADGRVRLRAPAPGANRRPAGENIQPGALALDAGATLTPQALAQLAAAGVATVMLRRRLRVALLSNGDELIDPGEAGRPDQVVDSNRPMLAALLAAAPWAALIDLGRVADRRDAAVAALDRAAATADVVVSSGGASAGDEDHLAATLRRGADGLHLWRMAMKPGRPLALGFWGGKPVFGLPGNPVAAFVCFLIVVRPALRRLAGGPFVRPCPVMVPSGFDHPKKPGRREFLRVRLGPDGALEKHPADGSGIIDSLIWSDGLADLPHEAGPVRVGQPLAYLSYAALGSAP